MKLGVGPSTLEQELVDQSHRVMQIGLCAIRLRMMLSNTIERQTLNAFLQTVIRTARTLGVDDVLNSLAGPTKSQSKHNLQIRKDIKALRHHDFHQALSSPLFALDLIGSHFVEHQEMTRLQLKSDQEFAAEFQAKHDAIRKEHRSLSKQILLQTFNPVNRESGRAVWIDYPTPLVNLFRKPVSWQIETIHSLAQLTANWHQLCEALGWRTSESDTGMNQSEWLP
ncbi:MAG: hypothetical protein KDA84_29990, partial [Planctomycetaceae bacterium]|nr:hypothetical protein [Planctomycetaceae bacterium]